MMIGLGGFLGSTSRYLIYIYLQKKFIPDFPLGTFAVNILGCFFLGLLFSYSEKEGVLSEGWRLFFAVGFCGSFTTFSTFALENVRLQMDQQWPIFFLYTGLSIFLGFTAAYLGMIVAK